MDKILIVDKEKNMTSHDVVNKIRRIFKTKRVGHTGTLDPNATGVLVVCLNEATKLVQFLEYDKKSYLCRICVGISTETEDADGEVVEEKKVDYIESELIDNVLKSFEGDYEQYPPMYSAIKVNGKRLYEYARKGEKLEVEPRIVKIFNIHRLTEVIVEDNKVKFDFIVTVSKGTYIRTLCVDIGKKLGYPAHMSELRRLSVGSFSLVDSNKLEDIENGKYKLFNMLDGLKQYPMTDDSELIKKASNGMKVSIDMVTNIFNKQVNKFVIKNNDSLIAIYELDITEKFYRAARVWEQ